MNIRELVNKQCIKIDDVGNNKNVTIYSEKIDKEDSIFKYNKKVMEMMKSMFDPTNGMKDKEISKYEQKIMFKIENGIELTEEEIRYVRMHMPQLYPYVLKMQIQRKFFEEGLKHCKSKEEAKNLYNEAVSRINPDEPFADAQVAAYDDAMKEFKKSGSYTSLPQNNDDKTKNNKNNVENSKNIQNLQSEESSIEIDSYFPEENMSFSTVELQA